MNMNTEMLKSKFRGCLLGSLLGDCLGAPYEGDALSAGAKIVIQNYFDKLDGSHIQTPLKMYTDDTAMTISVAKCLIDEPEVNFKYMARLFVKEYYKEPKRGYGANIIDVFYKLRQNKFEDIYKPALEQFSGSGSYGNGGAMRIAPIALYFHNNYDGMVQAAKNTTRITHTHKLGVNGALLQCTAIAQAVAADPREKMNIETFYSQLLQKVKNMENADDGLGIADAESYTKQLIEMQKLLVKKADDEEVVETLGTSISALYSVPTAIYCFLRAQEGIPGIKTDNIFRRTIQYAISLGGDTDTIASMAGAIAGAYVGEKQIGENLQKQCEFSSEMVKIADNLYIAFENNNMKHKSD